MSITKKIFAIGGSVVKWSDDFRFDQEIIKLSELEKPNVLFIPTATDDDTKYINYFHTIYNEKLGCKVENLLLVSEQPNLAQIEEKIDKADVIYVGGGNTLKMIKIWKKYGVDKLLKKAWESGKVMCGVSAGGICWFDSGSSDSMNFSDKSNFNLIKVKGLGFIKGMFSPHHINEPHRTAGLLKNIDTYGGMGYAVDDGAAIEIIDDQFRVVSFYDYPNAYKVYRDKGLLCYKKIKQNNIYLDLKQLYDKKANI